MKHKIYPVILSGGTGSRLWPLSRESLPKQLLPLVTDRSLLQETVHRVSDPDLFEPPLIVASEAHRFIIAQQLMDTPAQSWATLLEPCSRNTAAAATAAALALLERDADAVMLIMPADHAIPDRDAFLSTIKTGLSAAQAGKLVLFGIPPDGPATGYGYIQSGGPSVGGTMDVRAFIEKPNLEAAKRYIAAGDVFWNSGIFLLSASALVAEMETHEPRVLSAVRGSLAGARVTGNVTWLDAAAFAEAPSISIDHAVMERTALARVVASDFIWSDIGQWGPLWHLGDRDASDNLRLGDTVAVNSSGSYIRSEGPLVAAVGVQDLVIIATADAVLVAQRGADQDVKTVVEQLRASNHRVALSGSRTLRPWGWYEALHSGDRFQVKRISVDPGGMLSLQKHYHRAEHWVVVNGTALVEVEGEEKLLSASGSIYVPLGATHRVSNPGKIPLELIEVQTGDYTGEDDIVRFEDIYARI